MNLECLEAEYYSTAINGYGLNSSTLGSGVPAVGGLKANLSPQLIQIATELANDEINHVSPLGHNFDASSLKHVALLTFLIYCAELLDLLQSEKAAAGSRISGVAINL